VVGEGAGIVVLEERGRAAARGAKTRSADRWDSSRTCPASSPPFDAAALLSRRERKPMGEPAVYGAVAALRALEHAGLDRGALDRPEYGVIVSNDSTCGAAVAVAEGVRAGGSTSGLGSGHVIQVMASSVATTLSTMLGTRGACWSVGAGCAGGTHAIGQAAQMVRDGQQDMVLVVGAQETSWVTVASFDALGAFSRRTGAPEEASRPFDVERDGLVPSGGGACLVLESLDHAGGRGARQLARVLGYGYSSDGRHITSPSGDGAIRAMRMALTSGATAAGEVDYVNAHAASTVVGDAHEARSLVEVFGRNGGPAISSTKSLTGHEFWMAGVSEALYTVLMMDSGFVAATRNLTEADPTADGLDLVHRTRETRLDRCLSNSFGLGGTNASILLGRADE
jgi:3-oxoacyl-[acyl-carrier-protein] synthase-1